MHTIKSVGVLSCAKIFGAIQAGIGLISMPLLLLIAVASAFANPRASNALPAAVMVVVALFLPLIYGVFGFVMGALGSWVYNIVSGWIGGIELQLQPPPTGVLANFTSTGMD